MKTNEWATIKILLSMEHEKIIKANPLMVEFLNRAYFLWIDRVERHLHILDDRDEISDQEKEIMRGLIETHDIPAVSPEEVEVLARMFKSIRKAN